LSFRRWPPVGVGSLLLLLFLLLPDRIFRPHTYHHPVCVAVVAIPQEVIALSGSIIDITIPAACFPTNAATFLAG
jgi:hypothetical protein